MGHLSICLCFCAQARLFDEPQLASLCLDTIDKSTVDAISAEGFTDIDRGMGVSGARPDEAPVPTGACLSLRCCKEPPL